MFWAWRVKLEFKTRGAIIQNTGRPVHVMPQQKSSKHNLKAVPNIVEPDETVPDPNECPVCFGTGMEVVPGKGARICSCRKLPTRDEGFERGLPPDTVDSILQLINRRLNYKILR